MVRSIRDVSWHFRIVSSLKSGEYILSSDRRTIEILRRSFNFILAIILKVIAVLTKTAFAPLLFFEGLVEFAGALAVVHVFKKLDGLNQLTLIILLMIYNWKLHIRMINTIMFVLLLIKLLQLGAVV